MERESRPWVVNKEISYRQWTVERVKSAKLPFRLISPNLAKEEPTPEDNLEEVKQLKTQIERLYEKKY